MINDATNTQSESLGTAFVVGPQTPTVTPPKEDRSELRQEVRPPEIQLPSVLRPKEKARNRKLLFISYAFPPTGGGGVQRSAKFAKYLPMHGWQPTVLTVSNPSVPVQDNDLAGQLDASMTILRARTWEPGYSVKRKLAGSSKSGRIGLKSRFRQLCMRLLQPDPQVLWNTSALRVAAKAMRLEAHDAMLVTGPPFSSFLLGRQLKKRFGIPLILDFRDEWLLACRYFENHQQSVRTYRKQYAMMQSVLRAADAVIATTEASAEELARQCQQAQSTAGVKCIYNGFDPDDIIEARMPVGIKPAQRKLRIVYTGTLWRLTDISPLVKALNKLRGLSSFQASKLELVLAGRITPEQRQILAGLNDAGVSVVQRGYLPHGEALRLAATADFLLLLLADEAGAERVVPAKLFEYLALNRPILAISACGEASQLLSAHGSASIFRPHEIAELTNWLDARTRSWAESSECPDGSAAPAKCISRFSRPQLTDQLAEVLERAVLQA